MKFARPSLTVSDADICKSPLFCHTAVISKKLWAANNTEQVYLPMVTLAFGGPESFPNSLNHVKKDSTTRSRFNIYLFEYNEHQRQAELEDMFKFDGEWAETFDRFPTHTGSVVFNQRG